MSNSPAYRGLAAIGDTPRRISEVVNLLLQGKMNVRGSVTLTANAATTTLNDARIGGNSVIVLMPTTANAAGALATTYFGTPGKQTVTIHHANDANTDKIFTYAVIG